MSGRPFRLGVVPVGDDDPSAPAGCAALQPLRGLPLVRRAVGALVRSGVLDAVLVATSPALVDPVGAALADLPAGGPAVEVLAVRENGPGRRVLAALRSRRPEPAGVVVVHDPMVPLAPADLVRAVVAALEPSVGGAGPVAVVPVRPVTDTLKRVDEDGVVTGTVDRDGFRLVCSPQAFRAGTLLTALETAADAALRDRGSDALARLVLDGGGRLSSVPAPGEAFRVAEPDDLVLAEAILHISARHDHREAGDLPDPGGRSSLHR